jgi:hypothetical protein
MARKKGSKNKPKQVSVKVKTGLGDVIENITEVTGIKKVVEIFADGKDCGCDERKKKLNEIKSFSKVYKLDCFTEQEYKEYKDFHANRTIEILDLGKAKGTLESKQIDYLVNLYALKTNTPVYRPCSSCSSKPLIRMIEVLDALYNSYE